MKPKYQIIFLGNTPFEIVGNESLLREFGAAKNIIELDKVQLINQHYFFVFDRKNKVLVADHNPILDGYELIILPHHISKLTQQIELWDIQRLNNKAKQNNWGIHLVDDYLRRVLNGKPVEYDFTGTIFTLDVHLGGLFENDNPENVIKLMDADSSPDGYQLQYDPSTKNVIYPNDPKSDLPIINFDQMVNCHPLAMALKYDISISRLPIWDNDLNYENVLKACRMFNSDLTRRVTPTQHDNLNTEKASKKNKGIKR